MPKAVLWDIGNVVVRWNPRTLYAKLFEDPVECEWFLSTVCTLAWHARHDLGVSFAENRRPLIERFPEYTSQISAWEECWWEMFSGAIPETEGAIEALHLRGVPQYALSNMSHEVLGGILAMSPAFARLSGVLISAELAVMKPDARIYHAACERFGRPPSDFLFIDDGAANVAAARALGFDVHHFKDPAALRSALAAHGLL